MKWTGAWDVSVVVGSAALVLLALSARPPAAPAADNEAPRDKRSGLLLPEGASAAAVDSAEPEEVGCSVPDRGYGDYQPPIKLARGSLLAHPALVDENGNYDLLVHFHGAAPVFRLLGPENLPVAVAGLDAGISSSAYDKAFPDVASMQKFLATIDQAMSDVVGRQAHASRITVSSWSAGYRASDRVLAYFAQPDVQTSFGGLVLLDSLHASFDGAGAVLPASLPRFAEAAQQAYDGGPLFFLTHSAIRTEGYASTTQVADYLLKSFDASPEIVAHGGDDRMKLERTFEHQNFFVQGYAGEGKADHCAHLWLLPEILLARVLR